MAAGGPAALGRWRALKPGADDYLSKPFDLDELEARLRACTAVTALWRQLALVSVIALAIPLCDCQ